MTSNEMALFFVYAMVVIVASMLRMRGENMSPTLWSIGSRFPWSRVYVDGDMSGARRAVWIEKSSTVLISPAMGLLLGLGKKDEPTAGELLGSKANRRLMLRIYCVRLKRKRRAEDLAACFHAEAK